MESTRTKAASVRRAIHPAYADATRRDGEADKLVTPGEVMSILEAAWEAGGSQVDAAGKRVLPGPLGDEVRSLLLGLDSRNGLTPEGREVALAIVAEQLGGWRLDQA